MASLTYSFDELMSESPVEEPLIAGGVRCHGGDVGGEYVSPRSAVRRPAIEAWRRRLTDDGHPLIHVPEKYVPPNYPNYPQAKYLLKEGVVEPVTIRLYPTSNVFKRGHRIRLDISSSNFPRFDPNPNTGEPLGNHRRTVVATNTVWHDTTRPSHVSLPVVER